MTGQAEEIGFLSLIVKAVYGTVLALLTEKVLQEYQGLQKLFFCNNIFSVIIWSFFYPSLCISLAVLLHNMFMGIRERVLSIVLYCNDIIFLLYTLSLADGIAITAWNLSDILKLYGSYNLKKNCNGCLLTSEIFILCKLCFSTSCY